MKTFGRDCMRNGCIALAAKDSQYCAVHRWIDSIHAALGDECQPRMIRELHRDERGDVSQLTIGMRR